MNPNLWASMLIDTVFITVSPKIMVSVATVSPFAANCTSDFDVSGIQGIKSREMLTSGQGTTEQWDYELGNWTHCKTSFAVSVLGEILHPNNGGPTGSNCDIMFGVLATIRIERVGGEKKIRARNNAVCPRYKIIMVTKTLHSRSQMAYTRKLQNTAGIRLSLGI